MARPVLRNIAKVVKVIAETIFGFESVLAEKWAKAAHHRLFLATWRIPPAPEYYNHKLDLYWNWQSTRSSFWLERGVYSNLAIKPGASVLELCCGDGFNAYMFYSKNAKRVLAVDFDPTPIRYARKNYKLSNLEYRIADIRTAMPQGDFDNLVWDAAIEHFTETEIASLMKEIKQRLTERDGILSGYTIVERANGIKSLHQHEYEFKSKDDLRRFLVPYFKNVTIFETIYPERHNLYFWASDGDIPFSKL